MSHMTDERVRAGLAREEDLSLFARSQYEDGWCFAPGDVYPVRDVWWVLSCCHGYGSYATYVVCHVEGRHAR